MMETAYKTYLRFKLVLKKLKEKDMSTHELRDTTGIPSSTIYKMVGELQLNGVVKIKGGRFINGRNSMNEKIWGLTADGKASLS